MKNMKKAFTLVELIVVITILWILATIWFLSFKSYTSNSRDTNRISSIKTIQDWLELYSLNAIKYPIPDNYITLSWWNTSISQWILWKSVASLIKLQNDTKDPQTNNYYVYSTSWNWKYYQIWADLENVISYNNFTNQVYAEQTKAYVKWNYSFDPALPSLITISWSINTSSGIFDPNVCFVIDWWTNLISSTNTNCIKKKDMSLKDFDSSIVWYWDMESLNWTKLKDLSGNWNDLIFSWWMNYNTSLTWWILWKWLNFNWNNIIESLNKINYSNSNSISISIILNTKDSSNMTWYIWSAQCIIESSDNFNINTWSFVLSDFDYSNQYFNEYRTNFAVKYKINPQQYYITRSTERAKEWFKIITLVAWYWKQWKKIYWYINWIQQNNDLEDPIWKYKVINQYDEDKFLDYNLYIWNRKNYYWEIKKLWLIWTIDDIKIYNRALSDDEILQQAKIAGF